MALYSNILIDKIYKNIIEIYFYDHKANLYRGNYGVWCINIVPRNVWTFKIKHYWESNTE